MGGAEFAQWVAWYDVIGGEGVVDTFGLPAQPTLGCCRAY